MVIQSPLFFSQILVPRIWGGARLGNPVNGMPIGESWLFSPLLGQETLVTNGPFRGESISQLAEHFGADLLGNRIYAQYGPTFPLLLKILDTAATLSIQLHPDEASARSAGLACGKREVWYVLPEGEGASMLLGLREELSVPQLAESVENHSIGGLLNAVRAEAGRCYEVPAGTIHALDAGNFVLELQQPSDITYRLYDWDRTDARGCRRELHIQESLACATLTPYYDNSCPVAGKCTADWEQLVGPPFFSARRARLAAGASVGVDGRGEAALLVLTEGDATLRSPSGERWELPLRRAAMLPAMFGRGRIESRAGGVVVACFAE